MSCNHQLINDHLYDYIEGTLNSEQHGQCRTALDNCNVCQESYEEVKSLYGLASTWQNQAVPNWNRTRFAVHPPRVGFSWINWFSMAVSGLALFLVMLSVNIDVGNGLQISFGSQPNADTTELISQQDILNAQLETELAVARRMEEFYQQQALNNQILLSSWLDTNREERRVDLSAVVNALQSQRSQDQLLFSEQLNYLTANQIESAQYLNSMVRNPDL